MCKIDCYIIANLRNRMIPSCTNPFRLPFWIWAQNKTFFWHFPFILFIIHSFKHSFFSYLSLVNDLRQKIYIIFFRAIQFTRREIKLAYVTITIVGVFFILNIPRVFMGAYEVSKMYLVIHCAEYRTEYHPEMWYYRSDNVCRLFMVLNSSINFLIYCIGNDQFKV